MIKKIDMEKIHASNIRDLVTDFEFDEEEIGEIYNAFRTNYESRASFTTYIPLLTMKDTREFLREITDPAYRDSKVQRNLPLAQDKYQQINQREPMHLSENRYA